MSVLRSLSPLSRRLSKQLRGSPTPPFVGPHVRPFGLLMGVSVYTVIGLEALRSCLSLGFSVISRSNMTKPTVSMMGQARQRRPSV